MPNTLAIDDLNKRIRDTLEGFPSVSLREWWGQFMKLRQVLTAIETMMDALLSPGGFENNGEPIQRIDEVVSEFEMTHIAFQEMQRATRRDLQFRILCGRKMKRAGGKVHDVYLLALAIRAKQRHGERLSFDDALNAAG